MSSLLSRVLVAVIGVPVLLYVVLLAPTGVIALILSILSGIAAWELMKCVGAQTNGGIGGATIVAAILSVQYLYGRSGVASWLIVFYVVLSFGYAVIKAGEVKFQHVTAGIFSVLVVPYAFASFLRIEAAGFPRAYLLLPFILSFACDTFAYFVGCSIGRHKLAPKVSPKKSVEGSVGGIAGNVLCGLLFAFVMNRWFGGEIGYATMVILALACGVVAQVGDLSFSLIKREFGIKDYGHLFLAHGGVLDRFDSVLFVAPVIDIILQSMLMK